MDLVDREILGRERVRVMTYLRMHNTIGEFFGEHGQVGHVVLIGLLVLVALLPGVLIFHAVLHSATSTANCISTPNACAAP